MVSECKIVWRFVFIPSRFPCITDMQTEFGDNEQQIEDLSKQIANLISLMDGYIAKLNEKENFHKKCEAVDTAETAGDTP